MNVLTISRNKLTRSIGYLFASILLTSMTIGAATVQAKENKEAPAQVLFNNVNIFDGTSNKLKKKMNVLVEKNLIKTKRSIHR